MEKIRWIKVSVERLESRNLMMGVERHEANGATFLHPFDCRHLIAGHASLGLELVEQVLTSRVTHLPNIFCGNPTFNEKVQFS